MDTAGVRPVSPLRRLALLMACLGSGLGTGLIGWTLTADEAWFLAIPVAMVLGWLVVANPEQCVRPPGRRRDAPR